MFRTLACSVALAAAALFFIAATAEAAPQYVYGNYGTVATSIFSATVGYVDGIQNNTLVSQGFTTGTGQWDIHQVDVALAASGTGATDSRVYLFDDNAGVPGNILSTYSLTNGPVTNSKTTHFFTGSYVASPSTNYWLVLGDVNSQTQQTSFEWYLEDTGATPSQRNSSGFSYLGTKVQNFNGGAWTDTLSGLSLRASAVAVPEPSTYAFAGSVAMLAAGAAARRKFAAKR